MKEFETFKSPSKSNSIYQFHRNWFKSNFNFSIYKPNGCINKINILTIPQREHLTVQVSLQRKFKMIVMKYSQVYLSILGIVDNLQSPRPTIRFFKSINCFYFIFTFIPTSIFSAAYIYKHFYEFATSTNALISLFSAFLCGGAFFGIGLNVDTVITIHQDLHEIVQRGRLAPSSLVDPFNSHFCFSWKKRQFRHLSTNWTPMSKSNQICNIIFATCWSLFCDGRCFILFTVLYVAW